MITIVIPTRNRGYTLEKVLDSYYKQKYVTEIIIIDDNGNDDTEEIINYFTKKYPAISTQYLVHEERQGAAAGRITGYTNSNNDYILFGEDDAYLEDNYTDILMAKMTADLDIGLISGRIIYKEHKETNLESLLRFKNGFKKIPYFNQYQFSLELDAFFDKDISLPMTHALFLTKRLLLEELKYDPFYGKGNGYREESDFQLNAYSKGHKIIVTNDTHCFHMSRKDVQSGGQRINRLKQLYWNIYFTNYFFNKYFYKVNKKLNIKYSKNIAILIFSIYAFKKLYIEPFKKIPKIIFRTFFK